MGDLRDQLKKIKNALGLGEVEKKSASPGRSIEHKTIEVTVKKTRTGSLPPPVSKPVMESK